MPKFHVYGLVAATKYLGEFEAETAEEAVKAGLESEKAQVHLCYQCSAEADGAEIEDARAEEA